jgi:S1-C subfamily serine protease
MRSSSHLPSGRRDEREQSVTDDGTHDRSAAEPAGSPVGSPAPMAAPPRRSLWRRVAGDANHLGFWTLPVFVMTAFGGAIIAGVIANVYYAQQVASLEEETRVARMVAEVAASDIDAAREDALSAIDEQVDAVRQQLEAARPLEDPATAGVVALVIELAPAADAPSDPSPSPSPSQSPSPNQDQAPARESQADGALVASTTDEPTAAPRPGATPAPAPLVGPPPPAPDAVLRNAVGFVVAVSGGDVYIATSYGVIDDPSSPDGVAPAVTALTNGGTARGVVHAWDRSRHVAIVRIALDALPILPWRPSTVPVQPGDVTVLAAVTPGLVGLQLPGRVGAVTPEALITDLPMDPAFDGAPVLDARGRVVGMQSSTAAPFGSGGGSVIPAAQLCVELVSGCELLMQADPSDS